jgi:hypothetical protein
MNSQAWRAAEVAVAQVLDVVIASRPGMLQRWADRLGVSHQYVGGFRTGEGRPYLTDLAMMEAGDCVAFLAAMTARRLPSVEEPLAPLDRLIMRANAEGGDVPRAFEQAIADGSVSDEDAANIERQAHEASEAYEAIAVRARAIRAKPTK